ncbi:uncharacterized protein BDW70DRAFT_145097 [Aspergillus foveolatus]|uniref:uncharacterized protein n=1 Tax=Aspergillus foveolatus TaxID=210207 RepID=UPI003CCDB143
MNYVTSELFVTTAAPKEDIGRMRGLLESEANPNQIRNGTRLCIKQQSEATPRRSDFS